ncbi:FAD-dependent oxidoreductase [Azospirillum rugosum]|uniref:NADH:ubiquinone reductase (non-electrogenic) n=1 Tax=Azospirillum rugosum TaxID=416170 RepID=A0ABS4SV60_9PROT|nr:FAD-dependent oxidoreductase [Azospirillum rugosum]MBP2296089.1 NADH dehydrogenase/putative oxidoreductase [Azospirillum rugosum]MDQ0530770.1 NADH dehydrogenase/putative oxidoreductase [Azospirillum rugosum]
MTDRLLRASIAARDALHVAQRAAGPALDFAVRLWLAQAFWVSGIVKLHDWDQALYLAQYEYPVSWLSPVTAAWVGAGVELLCPPLLVLGLATRFAALPMLALVLVAQFAYRPLDAHLVQAALLAWLVVMGAGPLSLDQSLARGLPGSALPFAKPAARLLGSITRLGGPLVQWALRLLVAGIVLRSGHPAGIVGALLLSVGLGTRLVALSLIGLMPVVATLSWPLMLSVIAVFGPGPLSLDRLMSHAIARRWPRLAGITPPLPEDAPRVVVVGGGFGGLAAVRGLAQASCRVTLIDRRNHHLFQPLLYQVATASLSPADIATPIRSLLRDQANARVLLGRVVGVDTDARAVRLEDGRAVPYDHLVLATGARHGYFGREEWEPFAPGLKKVEDATEIRRRLLLAFEEAENSDDPDLRRAFLTFVVVGGGPTGVELAGAIAELARHGLAGEFRAIDPAEARVLLVQSAPRILPTFPEPLSAEAAASLESLGVTLLTGRAVEAVDEGGVTVSGTRIAARTVFWAAGVVASPAARWLGVAADRAGRVPVAPDLSVPGLPEVFAIGDTALSHGWDGQPVPGLAPAAKQGGAHVAAVIRARLEGRPAPAPFRYRHAGSLATIGRKAAVADFGRVRLTGAAAWWLWGVVHVLFLSGMRNRLGVAVEWFWAYLTLRQGTRLITGPIDRVPTRAAAPTAPALERAS